MSSRPTPASAGSATASLPALAAVVTVVLWASAFVGVRAAGHDARAIEVPCDFAASGPALQAALSELAECRRALGLLLRPPVEAG